MHLIAPILMFLVFIFIALPITAGLFAVLEKHFKDQSVTKKWPLPKKVATIVAILGALLIVTLVLIVYLAIAEGAESRKLKAALIKVQLSSAYMPVQIECHDVELQMECSYSYYTTLDIAESSKNITKALVDLGYTVTPYPGGYISGDQGWQASNNNIVIDYTEYSRQNSPILQMQNGNVRFQSYSTQ